MSAAHSKRLPFAPRSLELFHRIRILQCRIVGAQSNLSHNHREDHAERDQEDPAPETRPFSRRVVEAAEKQIGHEQGPHPAQEMRDRFFGIDDTAPRSTFVDHAGHQKQTDQANRQKAQRSQGAAQEECTPDNRSIAPVHSAPLSPFSRMTRYTVESLIKSPASPLRKPGSRRSSNPGPSPVRQSPTATGPSSQPGTGSSGCC